MINFVRQQHVDAAAHLYGMRGHLEAIADRYAAQGCDLLFFTSSGGSLAMLQPFCDWVTQDSPLAAASMTAADYCCLGCGRVTGRSLAMVTSKSGDTKETLAAVRRLKAQGVRVFAAVGKDGSEMQKLADDAVVYGPGRPQELIFYILVGRMLFDAGRFADYPLLADQLAWLGEDLADVRVKADPVCKDYAEKYGHEPYGIWVASGRLWPQAYSYAMCVLQESQWLRTTSVSSAEFFHGTLELVDRDVCVTLLAGQGPTRPQDMRVRDFCRRYTDRLTVFDTRDYPLPHIDKRFGALLDPVVMAAVLQRVSRNLEAVTGHPMDLRRYYNTVEY